MTPPQLRSLPALFALAAVLSCGGAEVPRPAFNLTHHLALQPVLRLTDGRWFDGGSAPLVALPGQSAPVIVTPAAMWSRAAPAASLPPVVASVELYTWDVEDARRLVLGRRVLGPAVGGLLRVAVDDPIDPSVRVLQPAPSAPVAGDILFVLGCAAAAPPCQPVARAVEVTRVHPDHFLATPLDPAHTHAHGGSPVLTQRGDIAGVLMEVREADGLDFVFAPASRFTSGL